MYCGPVDPLQARGLLIDLVVVSRDLLLHRVCGFSLKRGASNHLIIIDLENGISFKIQFSFLCLTRLPIKFTACPILESGPGFCVNCGCYIQFID